MLTCFDENILFSFLLDPSRTANGIGIYWNLLQSTTGSELVESCPHSRMLGPDLGSDWQQPRVTRSLDARPDWRIHLTLRRSPEFSLGLMIARSHSGTKGSVDQPSPSSLLPLPSSLFPPSPPKPHNSNTPLRWNAT